MIWWEMEDMSVAAHVAVGYEVGGWGLVSVRTQLFFRKDKTHISAIAEQNIVFLQTTNAYIDI